MLLDLKSVVKKYNIEPTGVIQVGAHYGEEIKEFSAMFKLNKDKIVGFEPNQKSFEVLNKECNSIATIANVALGEKNENKEMFVETFNNGQSNSLLKPKLHLQQYPKITFNSTETVTVNTLDEWMGQNIQKDQHKFFNFLNMDVQGYEDKVLKGSLNFIHNVDYIFCEINKAEVYENCIQAQELNDLIVSLGFTLKEINWGGITWGDAFYIRSSKDVY